MEYKDAVSTGGKENKDGAPYFEKLLADFKEHYFLMDEIAKKCAPLGINTNHHCYTPIQTLTQL
jgi:hypothetical protein